MNGRAVFLLKGGSCGGCAQFPCLFFGAMGVNRDYSAIAKGKAAMKYRDLRVYHCCDLCKAFMLGVYCRFVIFVAWIFQF